MYVCFCSMHLQLTYLVQYKSKRKDHTIEQVRLIFLWDPFLESIGSEEADYILVSAGAHQASEHFLTDAFLSAMRRFVAEMQVWQQKSGVKLLYLVSTSLPLFWMRLTIRRLHQLVHQEVYRTVSQVEIGERIRECSHGANRRSKC